jgi:hypothetical protein
MQPVSRQQIGEHVPAATNTNTTTELLLETVFSIRSVQSFYKEDNWGDPVCCQFQMRDKFCTGGLKIGPEPVKLKNLHC